MLNWLKDDFAKVNNVIMENMNSSVPLISQLVDTLFRQVEKGIRPLLTLSTSKLCQYNGLDILILLLVLNLFIQQHFFTTMWLMKAKKKVRPVLIMFGIINLPY